jgi:hypothetical protein
MRECRSFSSKDNMLVNILQISGAVLVAAGAALVFPPAGLIVAGAFAILFGMSLERR